MEYKDDYFPSLEFKLSLRRAASRLADLNVPGVESRTDNAMSRSSNLVPVMNVGQASSKQNSKNGGETTKSVFRQINRTLLMMPDDILTMVMSLLSYDEISQLRVVREDYKLG